MICKGNHARFVLLADDLYIFIRLKINYQFHRTVVTIFFRSMYNKTITIFGSYDIQNNQGLSYQPKAEAVNPSRGLDYFGYHQNRI